MPQDGNQEKATRLKLCRMAERLLETYDIHHPPIPIERMLNEPPPGLQEVDPTHMSFVMEHGLHRHAPRAAMARLMCRMIIKNPKVQRALGVELEHTISYADMKFFSRVLLMPAPWVERFSQQDLSVEEISTEFQVPPYDVVTRLAELGLPIPEVG
jgi:hypothetical protein